MPSLGSATEGMLQTQLDLQTIQENQFRLQEAPIKLEQERVALFRDKITLAQQMQVLSRMQNVRMTPEAGSSPDGMAGFLSQLASIQLESGLYDAGAKTAGEASKLLDNASKVDLRTYRVQNDRLGKFANILSASPDTPEGLKQAITQVLAMDPKSAQDPKFQSIMQMQWKPGLVRQLERGVLTAKEQAEVTYRQKAGDHADAAAAVDKERVNLIKKQEQLIVDRDIKIKKETGQPGIKADQLRAVTDMASVDFPGGDPADIRVRSRPVAEEAVKMMREQNITLSEAARRAYESARSSGAFSGLRMTPTQKGTKPGVPLPLPQGKDAADREKHLQQNQWYNVNGAPMLFLDGKFYSEKELSEMSQDDKNELGLEDDELGDDKDNEEAE